GQLDAHEQRPPVRALAAALEAVQPLLAAEQPERRRPLDEPDRVVVAPAHLGELEAAPLGPAHVHPRDQLGGLGGVPLVTDALDPEERVGAVLGLLAEEPVLDLDEVAEELVVGALEARLELRMTPVTLGEIAEAVEAPAHAREALEQLLGPGQVGQRAPRP